MKKLYMTISILFIIFAANCIGMEVIGMAADKQEDSPKPIIKELKVTYKRNTNFMKQDTNNIVAPNYIVLLNDLFKYIDSGDIKSFKSLLEIHPELKFMTDSEGNDILMKAVDCEQNLFIEFLLNSNTPSSMNLYAVNKKGENILLMASRNNNFNVVKLLINKDSGIMQITQNWKSAFIEACKNKNWGIAEYILDNFEPKKRENNKTNPQKYFLKGLLCDIECLNDSSEDCEKIKQLITNKIAISSKNK